MNKVAVYVRVSTEEQASNGTSLEHQVDAITEFCQRNKWDIAKTYRDAGYPGTDGNRPSLKMLLADLKLGLFDKVVVYALDRLVRKEHLLLDIYEKLKESGISLFTLKEGIDTSTPTGSLILQLIGTISEWEREAIIERTRSGRIQRYKAGCWAGGKSPYGYSYNSKTRKLVINEAEAVIVRRIFQEYNAGKSMVYIANMLNEEHVPPRYRTGKGWRMSAVRDIIINPTYKGTQYVNHHLHISKLINEKPQDAIEIEVPPIVSSAVWDQAQQRRKSNKHVHTTPSKSNLLQGLIKCGVCGHHFRVNSDQRHRTYQCRGRLRYTHLDGSPRCSIPILKADWLEEQVWQRIETILNDPNKLKPLLQDTISQLQNRKEQLLIQIRPINEQLSQIDERKRRLMDEYVMLNMDQAKWKECQQSIQQEEERLMAIRDGIDPAQIQELEKVEGLLKFWESQINSIAWNLEEEDGQMMRTIDKPHQNTLRIVGFEDKDISKAVEFPATKRELLDMLQVRLLVFPDRVEVKAVLPIEPIGCQLCSSACQAGCLGLMSPVAQAKL